MATVKIASVNGEWMNDWFTADNDGQPEFKDEFVRDGVTMVTAQAAGRLAGMIATIDADVVAVTEAPSRLTELQLFVTEHLSANGAPRCACLLGDSGGAQKLGLLWNPGVVTAALSSAADVPLLHEPWMADVDGDATLDLYHYTRNPLGCRLQLAPAGGGAGPGLELIVAHLKSNFINNGQDLWANEATRPDFIKVALKNRRRIATEAMHVRKHLQARLAADPGAAVIVLGDLNDGPGADYFEDNYLAHNVTDVLLGSPYEPEQLFAHAQSDVSVDQRYSAVFDDFVTGVQDSKLLLDHILCSPGLTAGTQGIAKVPGSGTIEHQAWAAQVTHGGGRRDQRPTDHRPATVTLTTD